MEKLMYDRKAVGERIRRRRKELELTQEQLADRIGRVPKYCADIERGSCGMSIDTMLLLCSELKMSPSTMLLGNSVTEMDESGSVAKINAGLAECTEEQRQGILTIVRLLTQK